MASTQNLSESIGILLAFIIGNFDVKGISIFAIVLAVVFATSFIFLPESPSFLLKQDQISVIDKSIENKNKSIKRSRV